MGKVKELLRKMILRNHGTVYGMTLYDRARVPFYMVINGKETIVGSCEIEKNDPVTDIQAMYPSYVIYDIKFNKEEYEKIFQERYNESIKWELEGNDLLLSLYGTTNRKG